jgi:microcystin-dependent protein
MTQPFIGEIQPFAFNFAPVNWALCNGAILAISQNTALFSLLGTQYGGNGQTTFGLPNLQSRVPVHVSSEFFQGEAAGEENVALTLNTMPAHSHGFLGSTQDANSLTPADGCALATTHKSTGTGDSYYAASTTPQPLSHESLQPIGGTQAHANIQPYLAINWCICMRGIFPSRS